MKTYINFALLREQLKRFWLIGALLIIAYFLMGIMPIYLSNRNTAAQAREMIDLLHHSHPIPMFTMVMSPFLLILALFPYHTSYRAAAFFYSLPIKKKQLFWTNIITAAMLMLGPLLLFCVMLLRPVYHDNFPFAQINTLPAVAGFFVRMAIGKLFYYAVFALAAAVAGSKAVAIILCVAFPFIPLGIGGLIDAFASRYLFGFNALGSPVTNILGLVTNPVVWDTNLLLFYAIYPAGMAVLVFVAYICSHKRKHERTGDSIVFTVFKRFFIFALSFFGAVILGSILRSSFRSHTMLYFGGVIGFVLAYIIAQMIVEKTLNIRHKLKTFIYYGGVMLGLVLLAVFFINVVMLPYVNRVPQMSNVVGVSFGAHSGRFHNGSPMVITDPMTIASTQDVHRRILANRRSINTENRRLWSGHHRHQITYHMADGSTIRRLYQLPSRYVSASGMDVLLRHRAVILSRVPGITEYRYIWSFNLRLRDRATQTYTTVWIRDENHIAEISARMQNDYVNSRLSHTEGRTRVFDSIRIETNWRQEYEHLLFRQTHQLITNPLYTENWLRNNGYID